MAMIDLTGLRFGGLTVIELVGQDNHFHKKWRCRCDCGGETISLSFNLRSGRASSCGCKNREYENLTGKHFGRLEIISLNCKKGGKRYWNCKCDCGKTCVVSGCDLKSEHTGSCGCLREELAHQDKNYEDFTGQTFGRLFVIGVHHRIGIKRYWLCNCACGSQVKVLSGNLKNGQLSCGCLSREDARNRMRDMQIAKKTSGQHGNRWNKEMSVEDRYLRHHRNYIPGFISWRKDVYKRDGYRCVICDRKNGTRIEAHHIVSWNANRDLRVDVNNGTTMCVDCHKEFHSVYGYGKNTEDQWTAFVVPNNRTEAVV